MLALRKCLNGCPALRMLPAGALGLTTPPVTTSKTSFASCTDHNAITRRGKATSLAATTGSDSGGVREPTSVGDENAMRWRKTYVLSGHGKRNQCTIRTNDGFEIMSDIPASMGGDNTAPQPVFLLLSALAGCETATAHFVARHMKIRLRGISFQLEAWRDQRGAIAMPIDSEDDEDSIPSMLQVVNGTAVVDTDASQEQLDALAHQVHRRCPVASMMIAAGCEVDLKWVKGPSIP